MKIRRFIRKRRRKAAKRAADQANTLRSRERILERELFHINAVNLGHVKS